MSLPVLPVATGVAGPEVLRSVAEFEPKKFENCGRGFWEEYERVEDVEDEVEETDEASPMADNASPVKKTQKSKAKSGCLKLDDSLVGVNMYELLRVSPDANNKELQDAYRKMCLECHPDKVQDEEKKKKVDEEFVKITTAYETLLDPVKRRKFDSSLPFDDTIPKEKDVDELIENFTKTFTTEEGTLVTYSDEYNTEFYEQFASVFERNGRFSTKQPVPKLPAFSPAVGSEDASLSFEQRLPAAELKAAQDFYRFWVSFDSWRDFDVAINKAYEEDNDDINKLEDTEKADCREERRDMEQKNARVRQRWINRESARVMKLVELAEKGDSRMRMFRAEEIRKKNYKKNKKAIDAAKAQKAKEDAVREAAEKEAKEKEEAAAKKKEQQNEKLLVKNLRRDLRNLAKKCALRVEADQFQELALVLVTKDDLQAFWDACEATLTEENKAAAENAEAMFSNEALEECIFQKMKELDLEPLICDAEQNRTTFLAEIEAKKEAAAAAAAAAAAPVAPAESSKKGKKNKKNNKKGASAVGGPFGGEDEEEVDEAMERAEQQADREVNNTKRESDAQKSASASKKAAIARAAQKKAQDKADAERQRKEEEHQAKEAAAKSKKDEAEKKKADENRNKQKKAAEEAKKKEETERVSELQADQFVQVRTEQVASFEKVDSVKSKLDTVLTQELKVALAYIYDNVQDKEQKLDIAAVLLANFTEMRFFEIAKRPSDNVAAAAKAQSTNLRNRQKKIRNTLRADLEDVMAALTVDTTKGPAKEFNVDALLKGTYPEEEWEAVNLKGGLPKRKAAAPEAAPAAKKKNNKKKADKKEEDLDAVFADLGIEENKKKKGGKKN